MKSYLMLVLAAMLLAVTFAIQKVYQRNRGASIKSGLAFNVLSGAFTALIFFVVNGLRFQVTAFSLVMAVLATVLGKTYTLLGFRVLRRGSMAQYSLFLMTGGMTVPYIWGILFLDEPFSWVRTFALVLMIVAIAISNYTHQKTDWKLLVMYLSIFFLNGFLSVALKMHQIESVYPVLNTNEFCLLNAVVATGGSAIVYLCIPKPKEQPLAPSPASLPVAARPANLATHWVVLLVFLSSAAGGLSSFLQLHGAIELPATVLYPFITGGSIIFTALADLVCFKTKLTTRTWIGVALCFIGTLLFL